jgi:predicted TIM-barrel fold metal-dependent hydrolase
MHYIDAHVHVWTDDLKTYHLAPGYEPDDMKPARFLPEEALAHAQPCGVDRIVLVQMSYYGSDNAYLLDVMEEYEGTFAGISIVDPNDPQPDEEMRQLAAYGVRGFRVYPRGGPVATWLDSEGYERMFQAGTDLRLALCPLISPDALPALSRRCAQFPQTPVIIDHLCRIGAGRPIVEEEVARLCAMAEHPSVMVKLSAFYALGNKTPPYDDMADLIRKVYEAFGPQRLMWASDSPYQVQGQHTYEASVALIRDRLDFLSDDDRDQVLRRTAEDFFFGER